MFTIGAQITAHEAKARWAYSELLSGRFGKGYVGAGPKHIHDAAAAKNPFTTLHPSDHDELVRMLDRGRDPMLTAMVDSSPMYRSEAWTKGQLAHAWALPAFNPPAKRSTIPYYDFYTGRPNTGPAGTAEESDPRVAARNIPYGTPFNQHHEPVIVIGDPGKYVLLEGYLRSIIFMRSSDPSHRLLVWVPFVPVTRMPTREAGGEV
jgi:hypothetical protein